LRQIYFWRFARLGCCFRLASLLRGYCVSHFLLDALFICNKPSPVLFSVPRFEILFLLPVILILKATPGPGRHFPVSLERRPAVPACLAITITTLVIRKGISAVIISSSPPIKPRRFATILLHLRIELFRSRSLLL